MRGIKWILFFLILLLLFIPVIQAQLHVFTEKPIAGYFKPADHPDLKNLSLATWKNSSFQDEFSLNINQSLGLRPLLFRINNQVDYSLYGLTHAEGFIKGKNGYLFQEEYVMEYTGQFFIGKSAIQKKLWKLKDVQDSLDAHGIYLLVVIEPGKASFYPEHIPGRYHPCSGRLSNYKYAAPGLTAYGIKYIDLNRWFRMMKDTSRYPLFQPYGMHWSVYGENLALDTIMRGLENISGKKMPGIKITGIQLSDSLRATDYDIGDHLNLFFPLPRITLAYPHIQINRKGVDSSLQVLIIADSYYQTILNDIKEPLFPGSEFWFYNSKVYPYINEYDNPMSPDKSNLIREYSKYNMILLMSSEINLHSFFWNFMDEAYQAFHPGYNDPPVYKYENSCRCYNEWFLNIVRTVRQTGRPLELQIRDDAGWVMKNGEMVK